MSEICDIYVRHCSPLEIKMALHFYLSSEEYPFIGNENHNETHNDALLMFMDNGIIAKMEKAPWYYVTEKGKFWINAVCSTPFPVNKWEIPHP